MTIQLRTQLTFADGARRDCLRDLCRDDANIRRGEPGGAIPQTDPADGKARNVEGKPEREPRGG